MPPYPSTADRGNELCVCGGVYAQFRLVTACWGFIFNLCLAALGLRCSAWAFSSCGERGATLRGGARALQCCGFSCCGPWAVGVWAQKLWLAGSVIVAHRLRCSAARGNLPRPGIKPVSPALAGGFLTTAPPAKSLAGDVFEKVQLLASCWMRWCFRSLPIFLNVIISLLFKFERHRAFLLNYID